MTASATSGQNGATTRGTEAKAGTREVRFREAQRLGMIEEMERDERVFLVGEEVGHYQGAYKVSQGLLARFGEKRVTLCFFGEGAANIGGFFEGLSLAALWKLPVVFICENNLYAMGTPLYRSLSVEDVSMKALAFGMARDRFDGDDVVKVRARIAEAVERARETGEPTVVEVRTYRFRGHSMSDPGQYRTKEEVDEWKKRDPVSIARRRLLDDLHAEEAEIKQVENKVREEIEDAVRFADESPVADQYLPFTYKEQA